MRYFRVERKDGVIVYVPAYTIFDFPYDRIKPGKYVIKQLSKTKERVYSEQISAFDIETSSYLDNDRYRGFMYIWQFCFDGVCVYGRYWEEFFVFLEMIARKLEGLRHVIYVHNLAFEYQFMYRYLYDRYRKIEVFATNKRKPLTVRVPQLNMEFRCSYKLSNMSLAKATSTELGCQYVKAIGDLDYSVYRDPETHLNDDEFGYSMIDVLSLHSYIKAKMHNEGDDIGTIPLTSTGYVRRDCRNACKTSRKYMQLYRKQSMSKMVYTLLKETGRGGDTAANYRYSNQDIVDVDSYDVTSSYPYQMLTQKYPMSKFYKYGSNISEDELGHIIDRGKAVLFRAAFKKLEAREECIDLYLPLSKSILRGGKVRQANGRVMTAEAISYTFTDIDWNIVKKCYKWEECVITDVYTATYGYLPEELREVILSYFRQKCVLKEKLSHLEEGTPEYEEINYLYMKSKNRLNGIFGMCFTDPVHDEILVDYQDTGKWEVDEADIDASLKKLAASYGNNFLVYAWGAWTTAHARAHLQRLISLAGEGSIYWDTDSDKFIRSIESALRIESANESIKKICEERGAYCDVGNTRYYLGVYERDKGTPYKRFKTMGAKKYCYVDYNEKLHLTVSGVSCHPGEPLLPDGARELKTIDNFKFGFMFKEAGGITLAYNDDHLTTLISRIRPDLEFTCGANVGTYDSTYTLGITKEYAEILGINIYNECV